MRFAAAAFRMLSWLLTAAFGTALLGAPQIAAPVAPTTSQRATDRQARLDRPRRRSDPPRSRTASLVTTSATKTADLALDTLNLADVAAHADVWEEVVRKLRGGLMPPAGDAPATAGGGRCVRAARSSSALDQAALANPNPGRVALHRLNRAEYANAIEDLLGVRVDAAALLPKDDEADGFDNVASVLTVSPSFLEQYISAARVVTNMALGQSGAAARSARPIGPPAAPIRRSASRGCRSARAAGSSPTICSRRTASTRSTSTASPAPATSAAWSTRTRSSCTLDGVKVFQGRIGGEEDIRAIDQRQAAAVAEINGRFQNIPLTVTAGPHKVGVTFVARTFAESDDVLGSFKPGALEDRVVRVGSVEILGPFNTAGLSDTPARQRVFVCRPSPDAGTKSRRSSQEIEASEVGCASKILSNLAQRAFRRPVTPQDLEAPLGVLSGRDGRTATSSPRSARRCRRSWPARSSSIRTERTPATVRAGAVASPHRSRARVAAVVSS